MADILSIEAPAATKPVTKRSGAAMRADVQRSVVSFNLATTNAQIGDKLILPTVPAGARGVRHRLQASVGLGAAATLALGITGNTGKYRAAAILNVATAEEVSSAANTAAVLAADEPQFITVAAAAIAAGTLVVETIYNV